MGSFSRRSYDIVWGRSPELAAGRWMREARPQPAAEQIALATIA